MAAQLAGLQIKDHHHLSAHQLLGLPELGDTGHDLSGALLTGVDLQHKQPVRLRMLRRLEDRADAQVHLGEILELNAVWAGHDRLGRGFGLLGRLGLLGFLGLLGLELQILAREKIRTLGHVGAGRKAKPRRRFGFQVRALQ